ncbi:peptidylprolyl isomerase [uncultured Eubacterium sp.]|uniref:peptidylprolyl isomerase n=1 Tax=uncultured Eubacterium sp. TaxID=165185 RepID=UPI0025FFDF9B|nr:peptidylprolyl isomerase [uncultured Eubacterium sp.]
MDEKDLNLKNENLNSSDGHDEKIEQPAEKIQEVDNTEATPAYEENDNWKFDGEAQTLNSNVIENDVFEIHIPESAKYETAERPKKATPITPQDSPAKTSGIKGDKVQFILISIILAAVIAVLAVFGTFYYTRPNSNEKMNPGNIALKIDDTPISIGMYNYYYTCVTQNYITYANYGYYDLDTTADYNKQTTTNSDGKEVTWAQFFKDETVNQIQYITTYYEKAVEEGITLTSAQKKQVKENLSSIKANATSENVSVDQFLSDTYGDYCGYATIKKMLVQSYIAQNYYQQLSVNRKVSDKEVKKYYKENKEDYENVTFAYLQVPYDDDDGKSTFEKCNKYAEQIKSEDDMKKILPKACKSLIDSYVQQGYVEDADSCVDILTSNIEVSITAKEDALVEEGINWLFDENTKIGEVKAFDDSENKTVYILYKVSQPEPDKEEVYSVRQILVMPDGVDTSKSDVTLTDEQLAEARKKAQKILDKYNESGKTEYEFAKLAEKYSKDTASLSSGSSGTYGGYYGGVTQGTMVENFNDWSMDDSRKYGDTGIVDSKYGCHIMFFISKQPKYLYDCETDLKSKKEKEFTSSSTVKKYNGAVKKLKVAQPNQSTDSNTSSSDADNTVSAE